MQEEDAKAISLALRRGSHSVEGGATSAIQLHSESQARLAVSETLSSPSDGSGVFLLPSGSHAKPSPTDAVDTLSLPPEFHARLLSLALSVPHARLPDPRLPDP